MQSLETWNWSGKVLENQISVCEQTVEVYRPLMAHELLVLETFSDFLVMVLLTEGRGKFYW